MSTPGETSDVERLMLEWNALRVTEAYRRATFLTQRDTAVERWNSHGPHGATESEHVQFRLSRTEMALREIVELEESSDASFNRCRVEIDASASLAPKDRRKALSAIRDTCVDAQRVAMRYRHTLVTTFQHEVKELTTYIEDRLEEAG